MMKLTSILAGLLTGTLAWAAEQNVSSQDDLAQAFAAPVLAAATNSPLFLGKRLWHETRIALFQQATDTRGSETGRTIVPRVTFGRAWVERSVLEIYRAAPASQQYRLMRSRSFWRRSLLLNGIWELSYSSARNAAVSSKACTFSIRRGW